MTTIRSRRIARCDPSFYVRPLQSCRLGSRIGRQAADDRLERPERDRAGRLDAGCDRCSCSAGLPHPSCRYRRGAGFFRREVEQNEEPFVVAFTHVGEYLLVVGVGQSEASDYQFAVRPAEPHRLFEIVQHRIGVVLLVLRVDPFSVRVDFQPRHSCGESRPFAAVPLERRSGIVAGRLLLLLEKGFRVASFLRICK